jgi:hypothetical protein
LHQARMNITFIFQGTPESADDVSAVPYFMITSALVKIKAF